MVEQKMVKGELKMFIKEDLVLGRLEDSDVFYFKGIV